MVTRILNSVENAAASKPKIDRFITRFARVYTPIVVFLALATAIIPSLVTGNGNYWIYTALSFLVMSCPCALVLSVPLAFFSGIGVASRQGILFKGGMVIESLSEVRSVVLDKTGTITEGNFLLQEILPLDTLTEEQLLILSAGCESHSTHPIAASIVNAAQNKGLAIPSPDQLREIPGYGIQAQCDSRQILCGNRSLLEENGIQIPEYALQHHGTEVFVAVDQQLEGILVIADSLKKDAAQAISQLHQMGLRTSMLTGDTEDTARAIAQKTGISRVYARLLPEDKLSHLQTIRRQEGCVLFVGDGINDAPVLAGADVGASMGSGAAAAMEAADMVFLRTEVSSIPHALMIARRTRTIARENVIFALTVKGCVMLMGLLGHASMWAAVFADSGVAMLCILNSIRLLYQKRK